MGTDGLRKRLLLCSRYWRTNQVEMMESTMLIDSAKFWEEPWVTRVNLPSFESLQTEGISLQFMHSLKLILTILKAPNSGTDSQSSPILGLSKLVKQLQAVASPWTYFRASTLCISSVCMELKIRFSVLTWAQAYSFKMHLWIISCILQHPPHCCGWFNLVSTHQRKKRLNFFFGFLPSMHDRTKCICLELSVLFSKWEN